MSEDKPKYDEILKRNYEIPTYADLALTELKSKLGKAKGRIVTEAIVRIAKAEGIVVHEPKGEETLGLPEIAKKQTSLDRTVKALARLHCVYAFENGLDDTVHTMLQEAVGLGTKRNVEALWEELEVQFSDMEISKDDIQIFTAVYGIPKKPKKKRKS